MLAEHKHICLRALKLSKECEFHIVVLAEVIKLVAGSFSESTREVLLEDYWLLSPNCQTIRVITVSGKKDEIVEWINFLVCGNNLGQIFLHHLHLVSNKIRRDKHSSRIEVWI